MSLKDNFSSTKYSPYIHNINPYKAYIELDNTLGQGKVYIHKVFDGILALLINISSNEWPTSETSDSRNLIFINYCIKGRCEVSLDNGLTTCVSEGEISISKSSAIKEFLYPLKQYEGIEFVFDIHTLKNASRFFKDGFGIDIASTLEHYTSEALPFTVAANSPIRELMDEIYKKTNSENLFQIKLNTLQLLYLLAQKEISSGYKKRVYLSSVQTQIAKATRDVISEDLQKKITVAELSQAFGVSSTTLKTYFKGLYGKNISVYLQELRMNEAAKQIAQTEFPVSEIAGMVGYENQSKFAAVFKDYFEVSPMEYRRLKRLEGTV